MSAREIDRPYPLELVPIYLEKVWGGRRLERLGRTLPGADDARIGESWELADLSRTSPTGAGGGAARSVIANGSLAGSTLRDAWTRWGDRLHPGDRACDFPLLVKLLDARENLSVQVHPSREYARAHPDVFVKSEAWYVIDADPDSAIYKGIRPGVDRNAFRRALESNDRDAVVGALVSVPARAGDCHYLPSGTCHALGAGVLVAEVQNPSDTTFRVYDWGRSGRALHVEEALANIHFGPCDASGVETNVERREPGVRAIELVRCPEFTWSRVRAERGASLAAPRGVATICLVLEGAVEVEADGVERTALERGETALLPCGLERARVSSESGATWLEIALPAA